MKRVLITGAGSYVGGWVRRRLECEPDRFKVEELDVRDATWRKHDFSEYDSVFHVAGIAHVRESSLPENVYMDTNCKLAIEVAKRAAKSGVAQFIFMSTAAVYGDGSRSSVNGITPNTPLNPSTWYGKSKAAAEQQLEALASDGFHVCILRCPMIYGPACKGNFVQLIKIARMVPIFPRVENRRSALHIDNLAEFVSLAVDRTMSGVYWPQDGEYLNTSHAVFVLGQAMGRRIVLIGALAPLVSLASSFIGAAQKAFGDFWFDLQAWASPIDELYRVTLLDRDAIRCAELGTGVSHSEINSGA